ncbi:hypothetical protein HK100_002776 [Physocladia obscura]|uniref:Flavin-containing monooxygenase n=1 Tax=Physocladia obscura TaxID=109957 RepID=A0AAD5T0X8_9FUNG|nr:hypothetical protein HK100_002776 [Physocladia obscura]
MSEKQVGIIGAGLAGLVAARHFLHAGWTVALFEIQAGVGGIWRSSYSFAKLQSPSSIYYLGEFPFPKPVDEFASKAQLEDYFAAYADHFGITKYISFNSKVTKIQKRPDNKKGWRLTVVDAEDQYTRDFDFVISAQGLFSGTPRIPDFKGQESFAGTIIHSSQLKDLSLLQKPTTIVVGACKTALEFLGKRVHEIRARNLELSKTYWIFRRSIWLIPENFVGLLVFKWRTSKRIFSFSWNKLRSLVRWHYQLPDLPKTKHELAEIAKAHERELAERTKPISQSLIYFFGYKPNDAFLPRFNLAKQCDADLQTAGLFDSVRSGVVDAKPNLTIQSFDGTNVHLSNAETIENVDVVILATGFSQTMLLPDGISGSLIENGGIFLYRNVVHPEIEDFAFIGMTAGLHITAATSMACHWLLAVLRGHVKLPSKEKQLKHIQARRVQHKEKCGEQEYGAGVVPNLVYLDQICRDLKISPLRKIAKWNKWGGVWNPIVWILELVQSYGPNDYVFLEVEAEVDESWRTQKKEF